MDDLPPVLFSVAVAPESQLAASGQTPSSWSAAEVRAPDNAPPSGGGVKSTGQRAVAPTSSPGWSWGDVLKGAGLVALGVGSAMGVAYVLEQRRLARDERRFELEQRRDMRRIEEQNRLESELEQLRAEVVQHKTALERRLQRVVEQGERGRDLRAKTQEQQRDRRAAAAEQERDRRALGGERERDARAAAAETIRAETAAAAWGQQLREQSQQLHEQAQEAEAMFARVEERLQRAEAAAAQRSSRLRPASPGEQSAMNRIRNLHDDDA